MQGHSSHRGAGFGPSVSVMVDVDGVIADFVGGFVPWAQRNVDDVPAPSMRTWDFMADDWGWDSSLSCAALANFARDGGFDDLAQLDDGVTAVRSLFDLGVHVHFVTSRPKTSTVATLRWIAKRFGAEAWKWTLGIESTPKVGGNRFVASFDDHTVNASSLAASGCPSSFVVARPWNLETPLCGRTERIAAGDMALATQTALATRASTKAAEQ